MVPYCWPFLQAQSLTPTNRGGGPGLSPAARARRSSVSALVGMSRVAELDATVAELQARLDALHAKLDSALSVAFGRRSERGKPPRRAGDDGRPRPKRHEHGRS